MVDQRGPERGAEQIQEVLNLVLQLTAKSYVGSWYSRNMYACSGTRRTSFGRFISSKLTPSHRSSQREVGRGGGEEMAVDELATS